ncbi:phosphotransferase enzyme family protein [Metarhizium guizhouense ARSEF 977]|uniref:Phosphotransferase enzyme family protein n=1 Tax=Metarhizium guizhouense (strain ARSEF 977) TaxID=1276136 RepID=A0A0B4HQ84_METGA|nr:phosphotransferase enzyme family protein [Metarhizium guizhouense ARSEF 977]
MQAFLIMDYVPGQSLDLHSLVNETEERRTQFFSELIDIFVQLRKLEFHAVGSLIPDPTGQSEYVVGNFLSMPMNELQIQKQRRRQLTFTSAARFVDELYDILLEIYRMPIEELSRETAELELFALHILAREIPKILDSHWDQGPFVLTHADLRCANIIVDNDFHIRGIIDWEWASTVPRQFFTPPPWITGHDLDSLRGISKDIYAEFCHVLQAKSKVSSDYDQLLEVWDFDHTLILPLTRILQHPASLIRVFYRFIYPKMFQETRHEFVPRFFKSYRNWPLELEVRQRLDASCRYTQYLKDSGLFVVDEESQKINEWLLKGRELEMELGLTTESVGDFPPLPS